MSTNKSDFEASAQVSQKHTYQLISRIFELKEEQETIPDFLNKVVQMLPDAWETPDQISSSILFRDKQYQTKNFTDTENTLALSVEIGNQDDLQVKISHTNNESFSDNEYDFTKSVAVILASKIERLLVAQKADEKQQLLDKAYKLARIGTWEYDMLNDKLHWSDMTKEVHGFDPDYHPDVESTVNLFKEGFDRDTFAKAANDAIEKEKPFDIELKIISGKGDERWIRATGEPEYVDGECVRFYGISQNVTDRRQAEEDLELNNRRFQAMMKHGMDMIAILDEDANYTYVSPTSKNVLGLEPEFFNDKNAFDLIHEDDRERLYKQFSTLSPEESIQLTPFRFLDTDENWRWLEATITNLSNDPAVQGFISNSRDITARQIKHKQIIDSLKEKETLLAEIHHRVKNNLSVLTGLLQLQAANETNEEVLKRLFDSVARIQTMASIHEQLYQTHNFSSIEFAERIKLLALDIYKSFNMGKDVEIDFQCEAIELPVSRALSCSLIVNEVLTNIFKHAFTDTDKGKIKIELSKIDINHYVKLTISDNGKGLPDNFSPAESTSLGITLIDLLAEQLSAEYYFESNKNGTSFNLLLKTN